MDKVGAKLISCIGCGALVPNVEGPTHRYMESAPGCWAIYGEVLARQYSDPAYRDVGSVAVDAYAVQHPGRPSSQSIHSVAAHLIRLYLMLEKGFAPARATALPVKVWEEKAKFVWLEPPASMGDVTVVDVYGAEGVEEYKKIMWKWARSAWEAWGMHHETVKRWAGVVLSQG